MSQDAAQTYEIKIEDVEYLRHDDQPLLARLYLPQGRGPFPLLAEIHGGAWCRGDRLDEDLFNQSLARRGIVVAALDFRMPPQASYPASLADINYGVRWLKSRATSWNSLPDRISLMGVSSGGHQAMLAAMLPEDPRYASLPLQADHAALDATVASVVLCWPVIHPLARYHYALALQASGKPYPPGIDRVIPEHIKFWGTEAAMAEGSPELVLLRGEQADLPPVLYLQGDQDLMHPRDQAESFMSIYKQTGGDLSVRWFAGEAEGFINKRPGASSTTQAINEIAQFLGAGSGKDNAAS